jgi:hypothetical protein
VHRPERLTHVIDRDHAGQLNLRMDEQAPDELGAAVTCAADDDGLESLHLQRDCTLPARRMPVRDQRRIAG